MYTRNRGNKHLRFRHGDGRFGRATLENTFGWTACKKCGRFFECKKMGEGPFAIPERVTVCPHCGVDQEAL